MEKTEDEVQDNEEKNAEVEEKTILVKKKIDQPNFEKKSKNSSENLFFNAINVPNYIPSKEAELSENNESIAIIFLN